MGNSINFYEANPEHWLKVTGFTPVFIFPSRILGGHELMALEIIRQICKLGASVTVYCDPTNQKLQASLADIDNVRYELLPFVQPRFEFLHALFNIWYHKKSRNFLTTVALSNYSNLIFVQGDIELGSLYTVVATRMDLSFSSYVPFVHLPYVMGKRFAIARDLFAQWLYRKTKRYITISGIFEEQLRIYSPNCQVELIRNRVRDLAPYQELRHAYLANRDPHDHKKHLFVIGRVSYRQKGHDILIAALCALEPVQQRDIVLHIVGEGEDLYDFQQRCRAFGGLVEFHGWMNEPWALAYSADLLVIPSRFEGVPLVMLEALQLGVPVIATARDGMLEYLLFEDLFSDKISLCNCLVDKLKPKIENVL